MGTDAQLQVLLIGDYPPPMGGIAVHVQQLHEDLRRHGIAARVLDIGKGGRPAPDVLPVRTAWGLVREVSRAAARGETVHLHTSGGNPKSWALVAAVGALCRPFGARSIVTLHSGLLPEYLAASTARRATARGALASYGQVVVVSAALRDALEVTGLAPGAIATLPPFFAGAVEPGPLPSAWKSGQFEPLLSFAHHPSAVYGRGLMFEALSKLTARFPKAGLAVFGPGTEEPEFASEAQRHGVADRLLVLGALPHAQALAVMAASDVFVRPTLADGDALSVREALALGVRCVASDAAVRPEGVVTFRTGASDALVEGLREALAAPPVRVASPDAGAWLRARYAQLSGVSSRRGASLVSAQGAGV